MIYSHSFIRQIVPPFTYPIWKYLSFKPNLAIYLSAFHSEKTSFTLNHRHDKMFSKFSLAFVAALAASAQAWPHYGEYSAPAFNSTSAAATTPASYGSNPSTAPDASSSTTCTEESATTTPAPSVPLSTGGYGGGPSGGGSGNTYLATLIYTQGSGDRMTIITTTVKMTSTLTVHQTTYATSTPASGGEGGEGSGEPTTTYTSTSTTYRTVTVEAPHSTPASGSEGGSGSGCEDTTVTVTVTATAPTVTVTASTPYETGPAAGGSDASTPVSEPPVVSTGAPYGNGTGTYPTSGCSSGFLTVPSGSAQPTGGYGHYYRY